MTRASERFLAPLLTLQTCDYESFVSQKALGVSSIWQIFFQTELWIGIHRTRVPYTRALSRTHARTQREWCGLPFFALHVVTSVNLSLSGCKVMKWCRRRQTDRMAKACVTEGGEGGAGRRDWKMTLPLQEVVASPPPRTKLRTWTFLALSLSLTKSLLISYNRSSRVTICRTDTCTIIV